MFGVLAKKFFGTVNERIVKSLSPIVEGINALEPEISKLSDNELKAKTDEFRQRLADGATLESILEEAFAVVREASKRTLNMRHFDVQLIGGVILHRGIISEMKTGEGKTVVATLAVYLNALSGKGVHVVTVNDYLAQRDAEWMGTIYKFLGLTVGCITGGLEDDARQEAYAADVTYGTNNEFGFDYLRDNMKFSKDTMVQRPHHFAIVDEVDSILIDEARTPLIISGPTEGNSELYTQIDKLIPQLKESDYEQDEKARSVVLTEDGTEKIEKLLHEAGVIEEGDLYDISNISIVHHVNQALRAHVLFTRDVDYIVKDDKVVIIDEFTGRMMEGRRYSEGLHQALEAKENVVIQNENQTLASVTFQNYFRLYPKLAGMTGTAMTEADEFEDIYNLKVVAIPTNLEVNRVDEDDEIYLTVDDKFDAIVELIKERHKAGQPQLIGTVSIEKSELIAKLLTKAKIKHSILNAKFHEKEAHIIAQAGRYGAVTIATNMAGRGTDIKLGGNPDMRILDELGDGEVPEAKKAKILKEVEDEKEKVIAAGGLFVIATERHESRRIDNQLRGRSGRQGDPGRTKFFLSLQDDLMRIFGSERVSGMIQKLGMQQGEALHHPWLTKSLEKAQQKVEARNYEIRKHLLKYDDVMNDQRKVIYEQRIELMEAEDVSETIESMMEEINEEFVTQYIPPKAYVEEWDTETLESEIFRIYGQKLPIADWAKEEGIADQEILNRLNEKTTDLFKQKNQRYGNELLRMAEKQILLITLDQLWKDHLLSLDHLRQGIGLRGYGQKDPLNEYKREAFYAFNNMLDHLRETVVGRLAHLEIADEEPAGMPMAGAQPQRTYEGRIDPAMAAQPQTGIPEGAKITVNKQVKPEDRNPGDPNTWGKVARNEPCPCESGKKYKQCHGQV